jgi:hypothetical protein
VAPIAAPSSGFGRPSLPAELWRKLNDRLGDALWPLIALLAAGLLVLLAMVTRRRSARAHV